MAKSSPDGPAKPTQRRYTAQFKRDAVALWKASGRPIVEVAKELGVTDSSLGTWVRAQEKAAGPGRQGEEEAQTRALRKRIKELEEEIEILKRFTAYWVKEGRQ